MKHQSNTCRLLLLLSLPALAMEETPRVTINERIFINSNRNELWEVEETQYIITEIFNHTGKWIGYIRCPQEMPNYIEDIYVNPEERTKGYATLLIKAKINNIQKLGYTTLEGQVHPCKTILLKILEKKEIRGTHKKSECMLQSLILHIVHELPKANEKKDNNE